MRAFPATMMARKVPHVLSRSFDFRADIKIFQMSLEIPYCGRKNENLHYKYLVNISPKKPSKIFHRVEKLQTHENVENFGAYNGRSAAK